MNRYRFDPFTFDPRRLELFAHRQPVALRHKTAALLKTLLEARGEILCKRELARRVWRSEHVQDQSVFQAISELRRALKPLAPIKTHPNLGYEWVTPLRAASTRWRNALAATLAGFALLGGLAGGVALFQPADTAVASTRMGLSPALRAFAHGMAALDEGEPDEAAQFFACAAAELDNRIGELLQQTESEITPRQSPTPLAVASVELPDHCERLQPGHRETGALHPFPNDGLPSRREACFGPAKQGLALA